MLGAFVPVALKEPSALAGGIAQCRSRPPGCWRRSPATPAPYLVLADNNGTVPRRTSAPAGSPPDDRPEPGRMEDLRRRRRRRGPRRARRDRPEDRVPPPLRRLCRNARRDRAAARTDRSRRPSAWSSIPAITPTALVGARCRRGAGTVQGPRLVHPSQGLPARAWPLGRAPKVGTISRPCATAIFCELGKGCVDFPGVLRTLAELALRGLHAGRTGCPARHGLAEGERPPQPRIPALPSSIIFTKPR